MSKAKSGGLTPGSAPQALGVQVGGYTDPDPVLESIRAVHMTELQERAR
jgi:hypothetical protein